MDELTDRRYTGLQIGLHWAVVALVLVQLLSSDAMEDFWGRMEEGAASPPPDTPGALVHAVFGAAILILMLVRIAARRRYGAPPPPSDLSPALQTLARANHYAFYVALILMPLTGATAVYFGVEASADLHSFLVPVLLLLVGLHVAGVLYHVLVKRDGVVWRILKPGRPNP